MRERERKLLTTRKLLGINNCNLYTFEVDTSSGRDIQNKKAEVVLHFGFLFSLGLRKLCFF